MVDNWNTWALWIYIYSVVLQGSVFNLECWVYYGQSRRLNASQPLGWRPTVASEREAEETKLWGPEVNTVWYGQEKKKKLKFYIVVSKFVSLSALSLSLSFSLLRHFRLFSKNKERCILLLREMLCLFVIFIHSSFIKVFPFTILYNSRQPVQIPLPLLSYRVHLHLALCHI